MINHYLIRRYYSRYHPCRKMMVAVLSNISMSICSSMCQSTQSCYRRCTSHLWLMNMGSWDVPTTLLHHLCETKSPNDPALSQLTNLVDWMTPLIFRSVWQLLDVAWNGQFYGPRYTDQDGCTLQTSHATKRLTKCHHNSNQVWSNEASQASDTCGALRDANKSTKSRTGQLTVGHQISTHCKSEDSFLQLSKHSRDEAIKEARKQSSKNKKASERLSN